MRTIEEFRDRQLRCLEGWLRRPSLFAGRSGGNIQFTLRWLLQELCFIDEREAELSAAEGKYMCSNLWAYGLFKYQHLPFADYADEVASTYAEVAFVLGYFTPETVACYACGRRDVKWVFFDLSRWQSDSKDWLAVPVLRDVRKDCSNRMHLLPFGRRLAQGDDVGRSPGST